MMLNDFKYSMKDGVAIFHQNIDLSNMKLKKIPSFFKNSIICGFFDCSNNQLISLEGSPEVTDGFFNCSNNQLTSLEHGPKIVRSYFYCDENQLTSLEGSPEVIKGVVRCLGNNFDLRILSSEEHKVYKENELLIKKLELL